MTTQAHPENNQEQDEKLAGRTHEELTYACTSAEDFYKNIHNLPAHVCSDNRITLKASEVRFYADSEELSIYARERVEEGDEEEQEIAFQLHSAIEKHGKDSPQAEALFIELAEENCDTYCSDQEWQEMRSALDWFNTTLGEAENKYQAWLELSHFVFDFLYTSESPETHLHLSDDDHTVLFVDNLARAIDMYFHSDEIQTLLSKQEESNDNERDN
ncbi:hypothetical protein [Nesterenkonia alba]|uniref:hypothetical protein n=1 Tax=Nesterenkonia alba TaxID=515814 RepID=UPI0003B59D6F|nr:hypothetical protein [Nesterenkonia alba]